MALELESRTARLEKLDEEIEGAEARGKSLAPPPQKQRRPSAQETANTSTVQALQYLLKVQVANSLATRYPADPSPAPDAEALRKLCELHEARDQQCLYRICAGVTAFKVRDPDPNAVDGGMVLGLRVEVMSKAQFCRPYFVMLNRPYPRSDFLRVHRHTVPPYIPLSGLAARHLPAPPAADAIGADGVKQDLSHFARCLRKEIVRHHNRIGAIADIRRDVGLTGNHAPEESWLVDVSSADPEAKQVRLEWANGRLGRVVMDDDGAVKQVVVFGAEGRDRETMRGLREGCHRIEDLAGKLTQLRQKEWQREIELEGDASMEGEEEEVTEDMTGDMSGDVTGDVTRDDTLNP